MSIAKGIHGNKRFNLIRHHRLIKYEKGLDDLMRRKDPRTVPYLSMRAAKLKEIK